MFKFIWRLMVFVALCNLTNSQVEHEALLMQLAVQDCARGHRP